MHYAWKDLVVIQTQYFVYLIYLISIPADAHT